MNRSFSFLIPLPFPVVSRKRAGNDCEKENEKDPHAS
jgi:hypothetical protein